jgi:hypothetical protein
MEGAKEIKELKIEMQQDPCEIKISFAHQSGCEVYNLQPIISIAGFLMIFVGIMVVHVGEEK